MDNRHEQILQRMLTRHKMTVAQAQAALLRLVDADRRAQPRGVGRAIGREIGRAIGRPAFAGVRLNPLGPRLVNDAQRAIASVTCPRCNAQPGQRCRLPGGQAATTHQARIEVYRAGPVARAR